MFTYTEFRTGQDPITYFDPRPIEELRSEALRLLADRRWQATQYFVYDGALTQCDGAVSVITATVVARQAFSITQPQLWKLADGEYRLWGTPEIMAFAAAVQGHIQACFVIEQARSNTINAASSVEDLSSFEIESGWP